MRLPAGGAKIANFAGANKQKTHDNGNRERQHNNRHLRERPLGGYGVAPRTGLRPTNRRHFRHHEDGIRTERGLTTRPTRCAHTSSASPGARLTRA